MIAIAAKQRSDKQKIVVERVQSTFFEESKAKIQKLQRYLTISIYTNIPLEKALTTSGYLYRRIHSLECTSIIHACCVTWDGWHSTTPPVYGRLLCRMCQLCQPGVTQMNQAAEDRVHCLHTWPIFGSGHYIQSRRKRAVLRRARLIDYNVPVPHRIVTPCQEFPGLICRYMSSCTGIIIYGVPFGTKRGIARTSGCIDPVLGDNIGLVDELV